MYQEYLSCNEKILGEVLERIHRNEYQDVHSISIVKDGELIFEEYFSGYDLGHEGIAIAYPFFSLGAFRFDSSYPSLRT